MEIGCFRQAACAFKTKVLRTRALLKLQVLAVRNTSLPLSR